MTRINSWGTSISPRAWKFSIPLRDLGGHYCILALVCCMAVPKPLPRGVAPIKEQYVIKNAAKECVDDDAAERVSNPASQRPKEELGSEPPAKAVRLSGSQRKKLKKAEAAAERKKNRGMNKARKFEKIHDENMVCNNISRGRQCPREK